MSKRTKKEEMVLVSKDDLFTVLDYLWHDEMRNYLETYEGEDEWDEPEQDEDEDYIPDDKGEKDHIYVHMYRLNKQMNGEGK